MTNFRWYRKLIGGVWYHYEPQCYRCAWMGKFWAREEDNHYKLIKKEVW